MQETTCKKFVESRCSSLQTIDFFDPLKKVYLQTFKHLKKVVKVSTKNSLIPLKIDRNLFARMALIGQFRNIDLKEVFKYPRTITIILSECIRSTEKNQQSQTYAATRKRYSSGGKISWKCLQYLWWNGASSEIPTTWELVEDQKQESFQ